MFAVTGDLEQCVIHKLFFGVYSLHHAVMIAYSAAKAQLAAS